MSPRKKELIAQLLDLKTKRAIFITVSSFILVGVLGWMGKTTIEKAGAINSIETIGRDVDTLKSRGIKTMIWRRDFDSKFTIHCATQQIKEENIIENQRKIEKHMQNQDSMLMIIIRNQNKKQR